MPNVGGNLNLPNSSAQNHHIDGNVASPFIIVNVAPVDTNLENGATEVCPRPHLREYRYWQYALAGSQRTACARAGDVVIRSSTVWHRGMPNRSTAIRPMLAFTWEDGGSELADPYTAHGGKIRLLTNRYAQNLSGRLQDALLPRCPR